MVPVADLMSLSQAPLVGTVTAEDRLSTPSPLMQPDAIVSLEVDEEEKKKKEEDDE